MNEAHDQALPASKKLHMMYVLSAEAMSELRDILVDRSVWVPHPDEDNNIGFTHKDDLAQVAWSFDCVLATLSLIEDAAWDGQHRDQVPPDLLAHLQQAASRSGSDWLHDRTLANVRRIHERVLDTARLQHAPAGAFLPVSERLMYALCSEAILGIYTFMQESSSWDRGLRHYELLDVLECLDAARQLMDALYEDTRRASADPTPGLLHDLASLVTDECLEHCRQDAVEVIRRPFHAIVDVLARELAWNPGDGC